LKSEGALQGGIGNWTTKNNTTQLKTTQIQKNQKMVVLFFCRLFMSLVYARNLAYCVTDIIYEINIPSESFCEYIPEE